MILAEWAGVAIDKARAYERSEHQRDECERAVLELQATRDRRTGRLLAMPPVWTGCWSWWPNAGER